MRPAWYCCSTLLALIGSAGAEVLESGPTGFRVREVASIAATPGATWLALLDVAAWWNPQHTFSGDARNLRLDARPGGCWCESLPDGGGVQHLQVLNIVPRRTLVLSGALGPLQASGVAGALSITLAADGQGTRLTMNYDVGGHMDAAKLAPAVDGVLAEQTARLERLLETGRAAPP